MTDNHSHQVLVQKQFVPIKSHGNENPSLYADFLPGALIITERPPAIFAQAIIILTCLLMAVGISWMILAKVDEIASGSGKVRPAEHVQIINHPTGGKISALFVKPGDYVKEGQILAKIDPDNAGQEVERLRQEKYETTAETIRLQAEYKGLSLPDFPEEYRKNYPKLVENELALFKSRAEEHDHQNTITKSEVAQRDSEVAQAKAKMLNALESFQLAQKQETATQELADNGYYPRLRLLSMQRDLAAAKSDYEQSVASLETAKSAQAAAIAKAKEINSDYQSKILVELNERNAALAKATHQLEEVVSIRNGLDLKSPVTGYVETVKIANVGQTIGPNQEIMHIIPEENAFFIDTKMSNRDIAHITEGQKAIIKITAFDYQRFGVLSGTVLHVPQDGEVDEKTGEVYFTVVVKPDHNYVGEIDNSRYFIHPGMTGTVELHIGQRSVFSYFLDVILRQKDEAFREY